MLLFFIESTFEVWSTEFLYCNSQPGRKGVDIGGAPPPQTPPGEIVPIGVFLHNSFVITSSPKGVRADDILTLPTDVLQSKVK